MLAVAVAEARHGLSEGGIPIGAALFHTDGTLLGRGHNRRVQDGDPSMHAETAAFRAAGRRRDYRRLRHGHHALTVLVLQRTPAPVRDRHRGDRRGAELRGRTHLGGRARLPRCARSTMPNAWSCWVTSSRPTPRSGTRTSACRHTFPAPESTRPTCRVAGVLAEVGRDRTDSVVHRQNRRVVNVMNSLYANVAPYASRV